MADEQDKQKCKHDFVLASICAKCRTFENKIQPDKMNWACTCYREHTRACQPEVELSQ